jgi:hypothetical protein
MGVRRNDLEIFFTDTAVTLLSHALEQMSNIASELLCDGEVRYPEHIHSELRYLREMLSKVSLRC